MNQAPLRDERGWRIARALSIALHPFVLFALLVLLSAWRLDAASLPRIAAGIALATATVWAFVWQRQRSGKWGTVDASSRHERPLLYAVALGVTALFWLWVGRASPLAQGVVAVIAMLCIAGIANRWIKLSLHMASLAFFAAAAWPLYPGVALLALATLPLLAWARLRMARHTRSEVVFGAMLGLATGLALAMLA